MTREEAQARCAALNGSGRPGRWLAQQDGDDWRVVQVRLPGLDEPRAPLTESTEARPRPPFADDPAIPDWKIAPPG